MEEEVHNEEWRQVTLVKNIRKTKNNGLWVLMGFTNGRGGRSWVMEAGEVNVNKWVEVYKGR